MTTTAALRDTAAVVRDAGAALVKAIRAGEAERFYDRGAILQVPGEVAVQGAEAIGAAWRTLAPIELFVSEVESVGDGLHVREIGICAFVDHAETERTYAVTWRIDDGVASVVRHHID